MFIDCQGKRVAIVGNSSAIMESGHGPEIDACDVIVRFNIAWPRPGNYEHIGTRTDVAVIVPQSIYRGRMHKHFSDTMWEYIASNEINGHRPVEHVLWTGLDRLWKDDYSTVFHDAQITHIGPQPEFFKSVPKPSSGISAINWFVRNKASLGWSELLIYGWDFFKAYDWQHGPQPNNKGPHNPDAERRWFLREEAKDPDIIWRKSDERNIDPAMSSGEQ